MSNEIDRRHFLKNLAVATAGAGGAALLTTRSATSTTSANTYPHFNVKDFGAAGNGSTNDTTAFQSALNTAGNAGGGIVVAPRGNYNILGTLIVPANVTLEGVFTAPPGLLAAIWDNAFGL